MLIVFAFSFLLIYVVFMTFRFCSLRFVHAIVLVFAVALRSFLKFIFVAAVICWSCLCCLVCLFLLFTIAFLVFHFLCLHSCLSYLRLCSFRIVSVFPYLQLFALIFVSLPFSSLFFSSRPCSSIFSSLFVTAICLSSLCVFNVIVCSFPFVSCRVLSCRCCYVIAFALFVLSFYFMLVPFRTFHFLYRFLYCRCLFVAFLSLLLLTVYYFMFLSFLFGSSLLFEFLIVCFMFWLFL